MKPGILEYKEGCNGQLCNLLAEISCMHV